MAELEAEARAGEAASRENERLRDLLEFQQKHSELHTEPAVVTARGSSNWSSTLTVSKGSATGIVPGNCVIDQYGNLVGIVSEVGLNWSSLLTVVDVDLELGGLMARTDGAALVEGDFTLMLEGLLRLAFVSEDAKLVTGDQVTTSGLGGVYPPGLVVGSVRTIYVEEDGISRYAQVEPAADIAGVQYVYVIVDYGE